MQTIANTYRCTALLATLVFAGCDSASPSANQPISEDPIKTLSMHLARGDFEGAAKLVYPPSRLYRNSDGDWVMASPGDSPDAEFDVRAHPAIWTSRFLRGQLKPTVIFGETESDDLVCSYLSTGVMCDPLQMVVRFVRKDDRVVLVVDPIGDRTSFDLD